MLGAAQIGQVGPNVEALAVARGCAHYIYQLLERVPVINSMSTEGLQPQINGDINFNDCKFHYPSRTNVPVSSLSFIISSSQTCFPSLSYAQFNCSSYLFPRQYFP